MKVEVGVVSKFTIKPSTPTPAHLHHYQLSFLDQIAPSPFMPMVYFYPKDTNQKLDNREKSDHLKKSLSDALTWFYPLAGRVIDNLYVDCNDDGVPYVEAEVKCCLSDVVSDPVPSELNKLLPCELDDVRDLPMVIQVNFFDCGGMAVAVGISHKIADALSFFMFITSWAATGRGVPNTVSPPQFESAALFPPLDTTSFKPSTSIVKHNIVTKRFVFTAAKISSLRDKLSSEVSSGGRKDYPRRPTRIEALSAFIWTRFMASTGQARKEANKIYTVLHAVNLRPRIDPPLPLPECCFGNISRFAIAVVAPVDGDGDVYGIVNQVRDAIRKVNGDYVTKLRESDKHLSFMKEMAEKATKGEIDPFNFTSLCRFPLYEADFGWGKPLWVGSASLTFKNVVVFMDTQAKDGIEAWVHLKEEDMAKFEVDEELLALVSPFTSAKSHWF